MPFRSLVKSTLLLGSSSAASTLVGIFRVKALALLVGPAGVGLLGTLAGIASVGTTLAALGSDTSATRQLALAKDDTGAVARLRTALLGIAVLHGLVSLIAFYAGRTQISQLVFGSEAYAFEVGLLGIAVALSLAAGLQIAQLQGLGRVGDIARVSIASSVLGTVLGLLAVWHWGLGGLVPLVLAQPALAALFAYWYASKLFGTRPAHVRGKDFAADWGTIVSLGAAFMLSYVMLSLVPLAIRAIVIRELGLEAAGHFHASWTMSVIYAGFLLNAMSADYFPRLTALVSDKRSAISLINDQAQLGLAIGGMIMIVMLAGAPLFVPLLYSREFTPAVEIFEWQALGNLMKIAGWPVAFLSMARGRSVQFFLIEFAWSALLIVLVWFGLPHLGLAATGIAFTIACVVFLVLQTAVAYVTYGFIWERSAVLMMLAFALAGVLTLLAAQHSITLQLLVGGSFSLILGLSSLRFVCAKMGDQGRYAALAQRGFSRIGWPLPGAAPISIPER